MVRAPKSPTRTFVEVVRAHLEAQEAREGYSLRLLVAEFWLSQRIAWDLPFVGSLDEWVVYWENKAILLDLADALRPNSIRVND